jgi:hypothetical protein
MPTPQQVQTTIQSAKYKLATWTQKNLNLILNGGVAINEQLINYFRLNLHGLQYQQKRADYTSNTTIIIYNRLLGLIGIDTNVYSRDPDYQNPTNPVVNTVTVVGFNDQKYEFDTTVTPDNPQWILANYHANYYPLFGNNPDLAIYIEEGDFVGDEQTPPIIEYAVDGNVNSDILSITYDFPPGVGAKGYVRIAGKAPSSGNSGSSTPGGGNASTLTFNQSNLLEDGTGSGNWYLPLVIGVNQNPIFTTSNGVSLSATYDKTFSPNRLYGFANNDTQVIKVTII